jgi:drug/metabolite transporter (DMT)-like permease
VALPSHGQGATLAVFMHWVAASFVAAFFLGCYELFTKLAVRENAVLPVLFFGTVTNAVIWLSLMTAESMHPGLLPAALQVAPLTWVQHGQLALKATIVAMSWVCTYFAVKHLPVSIASPIRATGPIWILFGALAIMAERPTWMEMAGIATTIGSFIGLSLAGRDEGIHFHRNKWIYLLMAGTGLGSVSAMYDRFLLGRQGYTASTVQAWFSIYLPVVFSPVVIGWKMRWWQRNEFQWRWSIMLLSLALLVSDYVYFGALRDPHALISLVSSIRRGSTLVAFTGSLLFFGEKYSRQKLLAVFGVLAGILLTVLG